MQLFFTNDSASRLTCLATANNVGLCIVRPDDDGVILRTGKSVDYIAVSPVGPN